MRDAVRQDRARVQLGKISRFGLLELSRQRLRPSLGESNSLICPRCSGLGNIRSVESLALTILRIIGEESRKERTVKVIAQLPVEVATYLINEKRDWVQNLEKQSKTQLILVANPNLDTPHYEVRRVRDDQADLPENIGTSYELTETDNEEIPESLKEKKPPEVAAITTVVQTKPAPQRKKLSSGDSILKRISSMFAGKKENKKTKSNPKKKVTGKKQNSKSYKQHSRGHRSKDNYKKQTKKKKTSKKHSKKTNNIPNNKDVTQQENPKQHDEKDRKRHVKSKYDRNRNNQKNKNTKQKPNASNSNKLKKDEVSKPKSPKDIEHNSKVTEKNKTNNSEQKNHAPIEKKHNKTKKVETKKENPKKVENNTSKTNTAKKHKKKTRKKTQESSIESKKSGRLLPWEPNEEKKNN